MTESTAIEFLSFGDSLRNRAQRDNQSVAILAADFGVSPSVAAKANWCAGVYRQQERSRLGRDVLTRLKPSHLEAAARAPEDARQQILKRAAREKLSVRSVKRLAATSSPNVRPPLTPVVTFGADDLVSSARAISAYLDFNDEQLDRLLAGPRGSAIKTIARSGAALAERIDSSTT